MKIRELFTRDIHRQINGVVKADQLDASSVWQELDEFVMTHELHRHVSDLIAVLLGALDTKQNVGDSNGVWVSGFFGSGKSHFIKVWSYLMENSEHELDGQRRRAVDFFEDKIGDAMLYADLKRLVDTPTNTILFNIDSKADHRSGRDTLLRVFLRVLNEKQGYSGDHAQIAHMERYLDEKGKLATFTEAFERASGASWLAERDAWAFHRDEVVTALRETLGQSESSVEKWVDGAEDLISVTPENFAKWVRGYLDRRGPDHRVMFLVDEVGQFIGSDTHLMLNLQTITEQLATVCDGRAWVVVTSQEDLDSVLGDLHNAKQHDFSKIQGRFKTRLSLSSANVDEVIKRRLLTKTPEAQAELARVYEGKRDILKNQLSFSKTGMSFKTFVDAEDFGEAYPFAAYQFGLVQKVFESIRKAGATGLHLSQGERSTLDAFQSAAKQVGDADSGALVPFHRFYASVEGFLDTSVKRTIEHARQNHALQDFDSTLLSILFLIRYVDELPGSIDNLVTLCVDEVDADRLKIRRAIEDSLTRLEGETLVARNGDLYFFLTNEERDIGREIKNTPIPSGAEERELGKILFEVLLGDVRKHTYSKTRRDFAFSRLCDGHPIGNRIEGALEVAFVSPLGDRYHEFREDGHCILETGGTAGRVLIRLPEHEDLGRELRTYIQTETYVKTKHTGALPDTTKRILRDRSDDNRGRGVRLAAVVQTMLGDADYFASGQQLDIKESAPKASLGEALEYLIENAYPKMNYLERFLDEPKRAIQSILRANDVEQISIHIGTDDSNPKALQDLREYVDLSARTSKQVVLHELIEKRYGGRPYGWPELEVVLLVARLAVMKEITLVVDSAPLALDQAYESLTVSSKQRKVVIVQRKSASSELLKSAQSLGKELFARQGPSTEEELFQFLKHDLEEWDADLGRYEALANTGNYPGATEIEEGRATLRPFVGESNSGRFLERFLENKAELTALCENIHDLREFYTSQKLSWDALREAVREFSQNRLQLEAHAEASGTLRRMKEILAAPRPYGLLHEVADLVATARRVNDDLLDAQRTLAVAGIQKHLHALGVELDSAEADASLRARLTPQLTRLLDEAQKTSSIAHIAQARDASVAAFDTAIRDIEVWRRKRTDTQSPPVKPTVTVHVSQHGPTTFLETVDEVEGFVGRLRDALTTEIKNGNRVQIR